MSTISTANPRDVIRKIKSLPAEQQRALVALLKQQGVDLSGLDTIARGPASGDEPIPLSSGQQRLWFLAKLDETSAYYNIPMALRLRGRLDRAALVRALNAIVERHEALRTRFVEIDGLAYQHVADGRDFTVSEEELPDPGALHAICERESVAPFDLERDSLIRVRLLRAADDDHVLLVTMHHSVSDGWSLGVFFRELIALYEAFCTGAPSPLEPLPIQYGDYARWQREWLDDEVQERQVAYWKQQLAGVDAHVTLPADRPRPAVKSYAGAVERFRCPPELVQRLHAVAKQHDATLYMTLLSAYAVLLSRYSHETDIAIGTPSANRNQPEVEDLIGFFVNTLVMRTDLSGEPTFAELLARVKATALEAYGHQDVPFEAVVDALQLERSLSYSPVFQVMFVLQEAQAERALRLGDLDVSTVDFDFNITKFDVTLDLRETPDGLMGTVEYNTSLFERETIQRFVRHYTALLEAVAADPHAPVSRLGMLDEAERRRVLAEWNDTRRPYSEDRCLHELFEDAVARHPERTALVSGERTWSYAELDARAERIARALRAHGVGADSVVGLCMERSLEMVSGILGIQKAGGAYMPMEPTYPAARLGQLLDSSGVEVVLTRADLRPGGLDGARVLAVGDDGGVTSGGEPVPDPPADGDGAGTGVHPGCLAYVIYTSGSTGRPKGVMIEHRAAVNRIEWMQNEYGLGEDDVVLQKTPFSFDVSVWEFFWPLLTGARLVVAEPGGHKDPSYLISLIRDASVTTLHFVPGMLRLVVEQDGWADLPSLRRVFCSGEALPADLCEKHYARSRTPLHNLYGPTEAAVDVSYWPVPADGPVDVVPIGRPIQNTRLYVLNDALEPLGIGCIGHLYIAGDCLARGYRNNPELTAEKFVQDPFGAPGERMYLTGDLARWLPDGTLDFLGRIDDQVKLRGFRIELGEIEGRLLGHPSVRSCVVVAREDQPGNQQLVAYVVLAGDAVEFDFRAELGRHLEQTLPEYMVPSAFVALDAMPVNSSGKLDRKQLPAPDIDAYVQGEYVAPRTDTERALVALCAELLGFEESRISVDDNFFSLGGHSLLITILVARLKAMGLSVGVRSVFSAPTLARLADEINAAEERPAYAVPPNLIPAGCEQITPEMLPLVGLDAEQVASIVAAVPGGAPNVQDIYPLVPSQEGILFHHLMDPANDPYVMPILLGAADGETADRFVAALRALVARHDVLRTAVVTAGLADPVQVVLRDAPLEVEHVALDPARDAEEQARALLERPGSMVLAEAPLVRLSIAADPHSERRFLLFRAHHLVEDAISLRLIFHELRAQMAGRGDELAPAAPYRDFVAHTLHQLAENDAEAFFRRELADVTEPTAPFGLTDVHGDGSGAHELRRSLPPELADAVRAQAQRLRTSPASLFHAAWSLVVAACSGLDDVVFGVVLSGRLQGVPGVESMLGNFINTLPLRVRLQGRSVAQLVAEVDDALKELIAYEQSSLIVAQRASGVGSDVPLFSSLINFRHFEARDDGGDLMSSDDLGVSWLGALDRTNYPLGVSIDDTGEELSLNAQVDASVSPGALIDYVATAMAGIVDALERDGGERTDALAVDVVPAAERERLLAEGRGATPPETGEQCLFELFEARVAERPDAIALEHGDRRLTYAETNARANRVAHYLRERGVGPDTLVGLATERSLDLVVGLLGILKAGGAYVPIDPAYPQERVRTLVETSGVGIVLSQSHVAGALPEDREVVHLDTGRRAGDGADVLAGRPEHDLGRATTGATPQSLAYVIFTSGSTGVPKGVLVEHRGVARLVRNPDYLPASERTTVLQHMSIAFDVGQHEVLGGLLAGARLVLHDGDPKDVLQLLDRIERAQVTTLSLSAAFLPAFAEASSGRRLPLEQLAVGGEAFSAKDVRKLYAANPQLTIFNAYGPTENSVASTCHPIPRDIAEDAIIPIGRPIAGSTAYVTDRHLRLVPDGVVGELCVGGQGVARGYLHAPKLTAERFVPDPFDADPAARLYRTGDLARRLPGGAFEFVGRVDHQVKVRGFRVELGEIETALAAHPAVQGAVVTTQSAGETRQLVAYVCPTPAWLDESAREHNAEHLDQWRELFEDQYAEDAEEADELNLVGWASSYTGAPIPEPEMQEWIAGTVEQIEALRPRRLLEVGCGTGLLLYRYAEACESVHAVDISASALAGVRRGVERRGWSHVTLRQGDALSVAALDGTTFDTIVVNSVAQYFPNRLYLDDAITRLLALLDDGGTLLIGDVRNLDLFTAHVTAIERSRSAEPVAAGTLASRVQRRLQQETELLVSPAYFAGLAARFPQLGAVDIHVKRGLGDNEMLSYRYDVVLTKGAVAPAEPAPWLEAETPAQLRALLDRGEYERFGVAGLTNPRVADDVMVSEGLTRWPASRPVEPLGRGSRLSTAAAEQVRELEDVLRDAEQRGYRVAATWSQERADGLDLVFGRGELPRVRARGAYARTRLTNAPQIARMGQSMARELKRHLGTKVPEHMIPSVFVALEALPLTPNRKVDKQALPAPGEADVQKGDYVAPRTATEQTLCRLISEVLGLERVGVRDTFFDLGGHSLLATRLTMRVRQETHRELPLQAILSGATVEAMAATLQERASGDEPVALVGGGGAPGDEAPLSIQQRELWFLDRHDHLGSSYDNVQMAYRIIGRLDRDAYARAFAALVDRHAILRTSYSERDGAVVQRVNEPGGFAVTFAEVGGDEAVTELLGAEQARPFRPADRHMLRVHLLRLSDHEHVAAVTRPWGIFDGWSTGIFLAELDAQYRALRDGVAPALAEPELQYADFARWQQRAVDDAALARNEAYWRERLARLAPCLSLRTDYDRPPVKSYRGGAVDLSVSPALLDQLQRLSRERGVTLYTTLLSAFATLLGEHTGDRELAIGSPVTNRPRPELERLVGYFVNVLILRLDVAPDQPFADVLAQARRTAAEAHEHKDIPFDRLVRALAPEEDPAFSPLFQVMFNLIPAVPPAEEGAELSFHMLRTASRAAKFDLNLTLQETPAGLRGQLEYSADLYARSTAEAMADLYERLLLAVVVHPDASLAELRDMAVGRALVRA